MEQGIMMRADEITDELNNRVGRGLGIEAKRLGFSNKETAILVLKYFNKHGLYTFDENEKGTFDIYNTTISTEKLNLYINRYETLNDTSGE